MAETRLKCLNVHIFFLQESVSCCAWYESMYHGMVHAQTNVQRVVLHRFAELMDICYKLSWMTKINIIIASQSQAQTSYVVGKSQIIVKHDLAVVINTELNFCTEYDWIYRVKV